jgi:hypothetical protein
MKPSKKTSLATALLASLAAPMAQAGATVILKQNVN